MFAKAPRAVLITGANRGLGLRLAKALSRDNWQIYATARNVSELQDAFRTESIKYERTFSMDLTKSTEADVQSMFDAIPHMTAVVHCASPYTHSLLLDTSPQEMKDYHHCMYLDTVILQQAANKLIASASKGVLAVTGAVIGLPDFHSRGIMGLVKANQRQVSAIIAKELATKAFQKTFLRHFDLGSFRDEVAETDTKKYISSDFVVAIIRDALESPEKYPQDIHLVSEENEATYNVHATVKPENFFAKNKSFEFC